MGLRRLPPPLFFPLEEVCVAVPAFQSKAEAAELSWASGVNKQPVCQFGCAVQTFQQPGCV